MDPYEAFEDIQNILRDKYKREPRPSEKNKFKLKFINENLEITIKIMAGVKDIETIENAFNEEKNLEEPSIIYIALYQQKGC